VSNEKNAQPIDDEDTMPIDAHVVALDATMDFDIAAADKPLIRRIRGVYLYDRNSVTHCCEFTPSYWLVFLYYAVELTAKGRKLDDFGKDMLYQKYEASDAGNIYMHVPAVEAIKGKGRRYDYGVFYEDTPYDERMESLREHFCSNCVL